MWKRSVHWMAALGLVILATLEAGECRAGDMTVRFDKDVYVVNGPGEQIVAQILIDGDSSTDGVQPVLNGLFSAGVKMSFNDIKADVGALADVVIPPEMDFFGFFAPALVSVTPSGEVAFHANIDQFNSPLVPYSGSPLATVTITNLAGAIDSYPLNLGFSRDLGVNEHFFVDGSGNTLDPVIAFVPSRVLVVPEPSTAMLALTSLAFLFGWRLSVRRRN